MSILRMTDLDLAGKRVLIRQDLNVPIEYVEGQPARITSDQRITASLPTLQLALAKGAAVMVTSHLGRPKEGTWSQADSLAPVAARLSELLGVEVPLVKNWVDGVEVAPGQIVLLENCRMNVGEGKDDESLSRQYAALCDVFVMDAFGTAHRAQASTHGVIRFASQAAGGPLLMANWMRWPRRWNIRPARCWRLSLAARSRPSWSYWRTWWARSTSLSSAAASPTPLSQPKAMA